MTTDIPAAAQPVAGIRPEPLGAGRELLERFPVIDGHNDLAWALRKALEAGQAMPDLAAPVGFTHTDLPRLAAGGVGAQFWSVYVPAELAGDAAVVTTIEQIDLVRELVRRYPAALELAVSAADVERIISAEKLASLLGAEGGHSIACSLPALRALYALGVRYMTLTHNRNVPWADSATDDPAVGGLTAFGREVVAECNRLGMVIDCAHATFETTAGVLEASGQPVMVSHSHLDHPDRHHPRLLSPAHARAVADAGGLIGAWPSGVTSASLADFADEIARLADLVGPGHVAVGTDLDANYRPVLTSYADFAALPRLLAARGFSDADTDQILGGNALHLLGTVTGQAS